MPGPLDECSQIGARRLADRIETYWRGRGYGGIVVDIENDTEARRLQNSGAKVGTFPIYKITSNIGPNGYPPK